MNAYVALAAIFATAAVMFFLGAAMGRMSTAGEVDKLKLAAAEVINQTRVAAFAEGEASAQERIALAEMLTAEDDK